MMRFKALKTFDCLELRSTYVQGLFYTIRSGNDTLAVLAEDWRAQGKIEYVDGEGEALPMRLTGEGKVWP